MTKRLALVPGTAVVSTFSYGHIKGEINILEKPDTVDFENYDHIVEGDVDITSGILEIQSCPTLDTEFRKKVPPGKYRIRLCISNLDSPPHKDNDDNHDDFYRIDIWPDTVTGVRVLKQFQKRKKN